MKVYQIRLKLYLLQNLPVENCQSKITGFIDRLLCSQEEFLALHKENQYKNYCFDYLYKIEVDKIYKAGNIYTVTIRTVDVKLAKLFSECLVNHYNHYFKALTCEQRIIAPKFIESLYTLTPVIIKSDKGYWKNSMTIDEYEHRLKINLIKKYHQLTGTHMEEDFQMFNSVEQMNRKPIAVKCKGITLLGDKIKVTIAKNESAQKLAVMALGTGLGEMNSRGAGFVNYSME